MSETVLLWIIGGQAALFLTLLGLLAKSLSNHLETFTQWQQSFLVEHGELKAIQAELLRRVELLERR